MCWKKIFSLYFCLCFFYNTLCFFPCNTSFFQENKIFWLFYFFIISFCSSTASKMLFFSFNTSIKSHTMCQIFLKPQRQIIIVNHPFICGSFFKDFFPLITRIQSIIYKYPIPTIQSILQQIDLLWFFFLFSFNFFFFSVASPVH